MSMHVHPNSFQDALQASGPSPDRGHKMDLYSWLIGAWDLDVIEPLEDGSQRRLSGEWHFGWVLEGRAIQDVWIVPRRGPERQGDAARQRHYYGSTLRIYDPSLDAWHVQWSDPVAQVYVRQIGRKAEDRIVQEGEGSSGMLLRWTFFEITPSSFRWRSEASGDKGATWRINLEFTARRA